MIYKFNNIEIEKFNLSTNGRKTVVESLVFSLFFYLIKNINNVVNRNEILYNLCTVSDTSINYHIKFARKALGDDDTKQQVIKTIHLRDYHFIAKINNNKTQKNKQTKYFKQQTDRLIKVVLPFLDVTKIKRAWTQKHDDILEKSYEIIDNIKEQLVSTVSNEFMCKETNRSFKRNTENLQSYNYNLRNLLFHKITRHHLHDNNNAIIEFKKVMEVDPSFARAKARYSYVFFSIWKKLINELMEEKLKTAKTVLKLSPNDTKTMVKVAMFYAIIGYHTKALFLSKRDYFLNLKHSSWGGRELGVINYCLNNHEKSILTIQKNTNYSKYYVLCVVSFSGLEDYKSVCKQASLSFEINP